MVNWFSRLFEFVFGLFIGLVFDVIWSKKLNATMDKLHDMEHYHWALLLLLANKHVPSNFLSGVAAALFVSELTGDKEHPFAYGKPHFIKSTIIGIFLLITVLILWYIW